MTVTLTACGIAAALFGMVLWLAVRRGRDLERQEQQAQAVEHLKEEAKRHEEIVNRRPLSARDAVDRMRGSGR